MKILTLFYPLYPHRPVPTGQTALLTDWKRVGASQVLCGGNFAGVPGTVSLSPTPSDPVPFPPSSGIYHNDSSAVLVPVIPAKVGQPRVRQVPECLGCHHLSNVPHFGRLVLAVGQQVDSIALGVDVGQPLRLAKPPFKIQGTIQH